VPPNHRAQQYTRRSRRQLATTATLPSALCPLRSSAPTVAMSALRRLPRALPLRAHHRLFHASAPAFVKVGDKIPDVELMEGSPGTKIKIADELKSGKGLVIGKEAHRNMASRNSHPPPERTSPDCSTHAGVPAAFSPACSESHIPAYINATNLKSAGRVFVVSGTYNVYTAVCVAPFHGTMCSPHRLWSGTTATYR